MQCRIYSLVDVDIGVLVRPDIDLSITCVHSITTDLRREILDLVDAQEMRSEAVAADARRIARKRPRLSTHCPAYVFLSWTRTSLVFVGYKVTGMSLKSRLNC